jgi:hypothetical protein
MAEGRVYIASTVSVIAVNGAGVAVPLGLVDNVRLTKSYVVEGVVEIGSFRFADMLLHGISANFAWGQAYSAGADLVSKGLVPSDAEIAQFAPIFLRLIDQRAQRAIALIYKGLMETFTIDTNARAKLAHNVSGQAVSLLTEFELN